MKQDILKANNLKSSLFSNITLWQAFSLLELSILLIVFIFGFTKIANIQQLIISNNQTQENLNQEFTQTDFQAIFLDNGQVYFGEISKINSKQIVLKNIYYLQSDRSAKTAQPNNTDIKLIKFGHELHAPKDEMLINQEHVLFIENLKQDSKVVKAIQNQSQK